MIEFGGALFLVIGFVVIFKVFGLVEKSRRVIGISRQAAGDLRDADMSDDDKEIAMQAHARQLFGLFFLITVGAFAAVFAPIALLWAFDALGWVSLDAVLAVALSWPFVIAASISIVAVVIVQRLRG